jgi:probable HAF family extracellular repeat protein
MGSYMTHHFSLNLTLTLSLLALCACDESPLATDPIALPSLTATAAASYSAQSLRISGEAQTTATSINTAGQVVGYWFRDDDVFRGFIWKDGFTTNLGTLGGSDSRATDINEAGQVVGFSQNAAGRTRAFRWMNGTMKALGTLGGNMSRAFGINNKSNVVGDSRLAGNIFTHAFLLKNGRMTDLGTLGGGNSSAVDINDAGQVVGWSETAAGVRHPFLWQNGVMEDLLPPGSTVSGTAYAINPLGAVVGEKDQHAFRYYNGVMSNLAVLGAGPSNATGIRNGRIVGHTAAGAFVLDGGVVTLLPLPPGQTFAEVLAVNAAGVIVGNTEDGETPFRTVTIWIPQ